MLKQILLYHQLMKNWSDFIKQTHCKRIIFSVTTIQAIQQLLKNILAKFFQIKILVVTINSFQCNFQYKILNNILYLNKMLFTFGKINPPLCSFCHSYGETMKHIRMQYV